MSIADGVTSRLRDMTLSPRSTGAMTFLLVALFTAATAAAPHVGAATEPAAVNHLLDEFEGRLVQDPASLRVAAEYRQLVIETGRYDRSIKLFERLARDPRGGANRFVNLALANVDKV